MKGQVSDIDTRYGYCNRVATGVGKCLCAPSQQALDKCVSWRLGEAIIFQNESCPYRNPDCPHQCHPTMESARRDALGHLKRLREQGFFSPYPLNPKYGDPSKELQAIDVAIAALSDQGRTMVTDEMVDRALPFWESFLGTSREIVREALEAAINSSPGTP